MHRLPRQPRPAPSPMLATSNLSNRAEQRSHPKAPHVVAQSALAVTPATMRRMQHKQSPLQISQSPPFVHGCCLSRTQPRRSRSPGTQESRVRQRGVAVWGSSNSRERAQGTGGSHPDTVPALRSLLGKEQVRGGPRSSYETIKLYCRSLLIQARCSPACRTPHPLPSANRDASPEDQQLRSPPNSLPAHHHGRQGPGQQGRH